MAEETESHQNYNIATVRQQLMQVLSDEQFITLCREHFRPVYNQFTDEMNRQAKVSLLIEHCRANNQVGKLLTQIEEINPAGCCHFYSTTTVFKGSEILCLFNELDSEPLIEDVQNLYLDAYNQRFEVKAAIETGQKALKVLAEKSSKGHTNPEGLAYARGKCNLLIASIYLNLEYPEASKYAARHYNRSQQEFHRWQWKHLESLVFLGLAMARRKLAENFDEAMEACKKAQDCIEHESIPDKIVTTDLAQAIKRERETIQQYLSAGLPKEPEIEPDREMEEEEDAASIDHEKRLQLFKISAGDDLVVEGGTTDLNLLSRQDYKDGGSTFQEVIIDLRKCPEARDANYVLEIDQDVKTDGSVKPGDWLLLKTKAHTNTPQGINRKTVAVLTRKGSEIHVSLKIFSNAKDHYFLKAKNKQSESIIIAHYDSNPSKISNYYDIDWKKVVALRAYDVKISGVVIPNGHLSKRKVDELGIAYIWQIPKVSSIAAGIKLAPDYKSVKQITLREKKPKGDATYFIFTVEGDSMINEGIPSQSLALVRQQTKVNNSEIAAVVIITPNKKLLGVLKRYYIDEREGRQHWFLRSSNPSAKDLVVIPSHTKAERIRKIYAHQIKADKVIFYENAEVKIAGKFVKAVEEKS